VTRTKLVPKVILEGTRLTLKTDIAFCLNEHPRIVGPRRYRYHSPLVSAEWCGFTNHPWGRGLINFDPDTEEAKAMEAYATWARLFELLRYYSYIVDRFHISTQAYQAHAHGRDYCFDWLEDRLLPLGFHIVFCTRDPATFAAARRERLKTSGKPSQYDDLQVFIDEQERLREFVGQSRLPVIELDVSAGDVAAAADRIADRLEANGGLWLDDEAD
jgi:hypothetical protein